MKSVFSGERPNAWLRMMAALPPLIHLCRTLVDVAIHPMRHGGDFRVYLAAAGRGLAGSDPYSIPGPPFVYPPLTVPFFGLFARLHAETALLVWCAMKLLALGVLLWVWRRELRVAVCTASFAWVVAFAFDAVIVDIAHGNISLFEQAALWIGIACWLRRRHEASAAMFVLAGCGKFVLWSFLILLVLRRAYRAVLFAVIMIGSYVAVSALAYPAQVAAFSRAISFMHEQEIGSNNPSVFSLARDWSPSHAWSCAVLWGVIVWGAFAYAWRHIRATDPLRRDIVRVLLFCLAFILTVPRLKNYSCIVLLPSVHFAFFRMRKGPWVLAWAGAIAFALWLIGMGVDGRASVLLRAAWDYQALLTAALACVAMRSMVMRPAFFGTPA